MIDATQFKYHGKTVNLDTEPVPSSHYSYLLDDGSSVDITGLSYMAAAEKIIRTKYGSKAERVLNTRRITQRAAALFIRFNSFVL